MKNKVKIPFFKVLPLVLELISFVVDEVKKHADPDSPDGIKINKEEAEELGKSVGVKATKLILDLISEL
jgi:hypothetical protein